MTQIAKIPEDAPIEETVSLMQVIARAAQDPQTDVGKMERLMAMHDRIIERRAQTAFNLAMKDAQAEMTVVGLDANNPSTRSQYASYAALDRALRPIYTRHGFSLSFDSGIGAPENHVRVLCYVGHSEGFTRTYQVEMPADGKGAKGGDVMTKTHAAGSAFTYGQRYLLKLIFNVATGENDDDGNAAGGAIITDEQRDALLELVNKTGADVRKFCAYMGVDSIASIPAKRYANAMSALEAKKVKQA